MTNLADHAAFVFAAARRPLEVATIFPTSRPLAERIVGSIDLARCTSLVELGPGAGAITRVLLERLDPSAYLGLEINPDLVRHLRSRWPEARFEPRSALDLDDRVDPGEVSAVVSSLPWTVFSREDQARGIAGVHRALREGGAFLTYMCVNAVPYPSARSFLQGIRSVFRTVERLPLEWRNIPPAFVYRCVK